MKRRRKTRIDEPGMIALKNHYCKSVLVEDGGLIQAWPSCKSFQKECNGGEPGELDAGKRVSKEWVCFRGMERQDIKFGNLSFQDWYNIRYGNANVNESVIRRFQHDFVQYHPA